METEDVFPVDLIDVGLIPFPHQVDELCGDEPSLFRGLVCISTLSVADVRRRRFFYFLSPRYCYDLDISPLRCLDSGSRPLQPGALGISIRRTLASRDINRLPNYDAPQFVCPTLHCHSFTIDLRVVWLDPTVGAPSDRLAFPLAIRILVTNHQRD